MKLSIVVPVYLNNEEKYKKTKECITTLLDHGLGDKDVELILIHDRSPFKKRIGIGDEVFLDNNEGKSYGFARTVNTGLAQARGSYIAVVNDDIKAPQGWAREMIKDLDKFKVDILCSTESDIAQIDNSGYVDKSTYGFFGSCWLMKKDTYERLGGISEEYYPFLWEDTDYWMRALAKNMILVQDRRVQVFHYKSLATGSNPNYKEIYDKNRKTFIDKWGEDKINLFH